MSAPSKASLGKLVDLPSVADKHFLSRVADELEKLSTESERRGHPFLALLLDLTKSEAEDDLKTARILRVSSKHAKAREHGSDDDEGVVQLAEKLAWRATRSA